jgi:hypothetical protein
MTVDSDLKVTLGLLWIDPAFGLGFGLDWRRGGSHAF